MRHRVAAAVITVIGIAAAPVEATCGAYAVCSDVTASLVGTIGSEGITVTWNTANENAQLGHFELKRYNCGNPDNCSVDVATITPAGTCGTTHNYSFTDNPPAPLSQWIYIVEVWRSDATRACAVDVTPH